jgi:hypothetical protein
MWVIVALWWSRTYRHTGVFGCTSPPHPVAAEGGSLKGVCPMSHVTCVTRAACDARHITRVTHVTCDMCHREGVPHFTRDMRHPPGVTLVTNTSALGAPNKLYWRGPIGCIGAANTAPVYGRARPCVRFNKPRARLLAPLIESSQFGACLLT